VKLIRLQSGPLACVYQDEDAAPATERERSGIYHAFSGSVEANGASESEALDILDRNLLRLSEPAAAASRADTDAEQAASSPTRDTDHCPPRFESILPPPSNYPPDTVRAPRSSSLPAVAFTARARAYHRTISGEFLRQGFGDAHAVEGSTDDAACVTPAFARRI
jgi:hypothetical protein